MKTESGAVFAIQIEHNEVLADLVYVKKRIERMLNLCNAPGLTDEDKYKALAEMVWETADCLDDSF